MSNKRSSALRPTRTASIPTSRSRPEAIDELEDVLLDAQQVIAEKLPEGDPLDTVTEITKIVDGSKQRAAQTAAHRARAKLARAAKQ